MDKSDSLKHGKIFVISAPSGAGKTTLLKKLRICFPFLVESVSCTTRRPRSNEQNGADYFFLTLEQFLDKREKGDFVEWAEVHGNYYGTPLEFLKINVEQGRDVVCDVDYQGALNIAKCFPGKAVLILILPPSIKELGQRLRSRATDDEAAIKKRLQKAQKEISFYPYFDFAVVNDDLENAFRQLKNIVAAHTESSITRNLKTIMNLMGKDE